MSQIGIEFANQWIAENIRPSFYAPEGDRHPETKATLARFLADAREDGITRQEIEEDMGDLSDFISAALEEATEAEVERLEDDED
ncbi:MAG: DUF768 domain-containing protein [Sphingopyxis sp.]|uniref:DUF768 domain-containing protein n=1 Tax=Sphingopyxis sp. TaxID=1908224 RepID=UPI003D810178